MKTKTFDAVGESRKWKEEIAQQTQGMTREQVLAYFDKEAVHRRFQKSLKRAQKKVSGGDSC